MMDGLVLDSYFKLLLRLLFLSKHQIAFISYRMMISNASASMSAVVVGVLCHPI